MLLGILVGLDICLIFFRLFLSLSHPELPTYISFIFDSLMAVVTSTIITLSAHNFIHKKFPDTVELLGIFSFLIWVSLLASYFTLRYAKDYQTALSILVTGALVCMGWWIQSITSAAQSRRKHTLEIILSTRTSEVYQKKLNKYSHLYHGNTHVAKKFAQWRSFPNLPEFSNACVPDNYRNAINGLLYILNYFEFLAQGVKAKDLDDCLLKECFSGFIKDLEKKAFYLIIEAQKVNPQNFEGLIYLSKKWNGESLVEKYQNNSHNIDLGIAIPSDENIQKFLCCKKDCQ